METRKRILEKTLELFLVQGYENTSMRQIAEALGITKPAIYHYFHGKSELALQVVDFFRERMNSWSQEHFAGADDFPSFLERLCAAIPVFSHVETLLLGSEYNGEFCQGFDDLIAALARENPIVRERMAEIFAATRNHITTLAVEAVKKGMMRDDIDPTTLGLVISSTIEGLGVLHRFDPNLDLGRISPTVFQLYQTMLGLRPREE